MCSLNHAINLYKEDKKCYQCKSTEIYKEVKSTDLKGSNGIYLGKVPICKNCFDKIDIKRD